MNTSGQELISESISNPSKHSLDIGSLAKGVYFVRLEAGNSTSTRKFIKL
ncbi:T9SS C-terminal target domain-containing protein [bacterium]|nr:T9SS C-terminal target domain-containing protein [Candidatus Elulimicrobium humile]